MTNVNNAGSKSTPAVSCECDADTGTVKVTFANGDTVKVVANELNLEIRNMAILHGIKQKLVDAAALPRDTVTGRSATIGDKISAVREVFDRITSTDGTWNKIRSNGEGVQSGGLFVRALMELSGKSREEIVEQLEGYSKEQRAALRTNKRVVEAMANLREPSEDAEDLLQSILA
jgi:hypothetical protein